MSRSNDLAAIESGLISVRGLNNSVISASKILTESETGFILASAASSTVTITLPSASKSMDIRIQRVDNSGNRLVVQAAGAEKIKFHTYLRAEGYPFLLLMGAGDFWHLRSDGAGNWIPLGRMDTTALGRPVYETSVAINPGGWGAVNGAVMNRVDWPWLWDHAQKSGMLTSEAERVGMEGGWTSGDGSTTFRIPAGGGEFIRMLDEQGTVERPAIQGTTTLNSMSVTAVAWRGVRPFVGMPITGANIPGGTTISGFNIAAGTLSLSAAATAAGQGELVLYGRAPGSWQKASLIVSDDNADGMWNVAATGYAPAASRTQTVAGMDAFAASDYAGMRVVGIAPTTSFDLPGVASNMATVGAARARNIAYPGRIKLI